MDDKANKKVNNVQDLKQVIKVLLNSEKKVLSLQEFSSRDFSLLNQQFLKYHKHTKEFLKRIFEFKNHLWEDVSDKKYNLKDVLALIEKNIYFLDLIKSGLSARMEFLNQLNEKIEFIQIPLNNYKQNLYTLKLLSTNLKIEKTTTVKNEKVAAKIDDLIIMFESFSLFFPKIDKQVNEFQNDLDVLNIMYHKLFKNIADHFEGGLNELFEFADVYLKKIMSAETNSKGIDQDYKESQKNVETIITKLQYQDIIRQRIEHIQETHKEMTDNLQNVLKENREETTKAVLFQIKDIIGLQSAHLIHINQEFQKAIEIISDKIKTYNGNISSLTESANALTDSFSSINTWDQVKKERLDDLFKNIPDMEKDVESISIQNEKIIHSSVELIKYLNEIIDITDQIKKVNQKISSFSASATISKISGMLNDNVKLTEKIEEQIKTINRYVEEPNTSKRNIKESSTQFIEQVHLLKKSSLTNLIKKISSQIIELNDEITINKNEQKLINNALHELKYYQFFEKNVQEIIQNLNEINEFFKKSLKQEEDKEKDNIDHVKSRYTTEIEHNVHDSYSSHDESVFKELISELNSREDEEKDNIEFF